MHTALVGLDHARSQLTWTRRNASAMIADLDLYDPVYTPPQVLTPSATPYKDELPVRQTGLYVQDQLKWQRWVLTTGLRRDWVDQSQTRTYFDTGAKTVSYDQQSQATTGRAGLVYLFDNGWAPYVSYATSFAPETGNDVDGKPLSPSRGKQIEAGVRYQPEGQAVSYTAAVFDLVRDNVKTNVPGMTNAYIQTGEVTSRGLELEARAALTPRLSVIAQYTYLDTEVTRSNNGDQGLALQGAPKHSASAWLRQAVDLSFGQAYTALGLRHLGTARSGQDTDNQDLRNPSLTLVDAALGIDGGAWRLSFNVNNLFDTQELIDCDGTYCYRSAERTASVSALFRF
jgi:iron complex outermembrane receptor protein